jgi:hypothetical protein
MEEVFFPARRKFVAETEISENARADFRHSTKLDVDLPRAHREHGAVPEQVDLQDHRAHIPRTHSPTDLVIRIHLHARRFVSKI